MQISATIDSALRTLAATVAVDANAVRAALEHEDWVATAHLLHRNAGDLDRLRRAVMIVTDIGAGCALLTDETEQEIVAALLAIADGIAQ